MPELTDTGNVERRDDGTLVFTHGHRFPDNTQRVVQEYDAAGRLKTVKVQLTGFAGKVLDVTATVDEQGKVVQEDGYRAPDVRTSVQDLIRPLPAHAASSASPARPAAQGPESGPEPVSPQPVSPVGLTATSEIRAGLEQIYGERNN